MIRKINRLIGVLGWTALSACAGNPQVAGNGFAPRSEHDVPRRTSNATVLEAAEIHQRGGNLLSALRQRMHSMQVQYTEGCPNVTLRGQKSVLGSSSPRVYVNGQPAMDTCILDLIRADDVERVEVYPMGVAPRPGYLSHPNGLILVFTRTA